MELREGGKNLRGQYALYARDRIYNDPERQDELDQMLADEVNELKGNFEIRTDSAVCRMKDREGLRRKRSTLLEPPNRNRTAEVRSSASSIHLSKADNLILGGQTCPRACEDLVN